MKISKNKSGKTAKPATKSKHKTEKMRINVHPDEVFKVLLSKPK